MTYGTQREAPSQSRRQPAMLHCSVAGQTTGIAAGQRVLLDTADFSSPSVGSAVVLSTAPAGLIALQPGSLYELQGWLTVVDFDTTGRLDVRWALSEAPFTALGTQAGRDRASDIVRSGPAVTYFDARALLVATVLELRMVTVSGAVDSLSAVATVREL